MKTTTAKPRLTPRLRFPEFRNGPGWEACQLKELADFVGDRISVSELNRADYVSTENLLSDFGGFSFPSSFPAGGSVVRYRVNDILAANIRPYLKKIWLADRNGGASNDVIVIRTQSSIDHQYLSHVLKNDRFIAYVMSGAKGLKMPRGDVSLIREYPVPTPSLAEQHRIASCLSSFDDLIAAQSDKVETLKTHKQGLMQGLFPAPEEGEA
jgi:type I restriction enzyme S subunit